MFNTYTLALNNTSVALTGSIPASVVFDPSAHNSLKKIYSAVYNFGDGTPTEIVTYTKYPAELNLPNIEPATKSIKHTYYKAGSYAGSVSFYKIGDSTPTVITFTLTFAKAALSNLKVVKSSMYGSSNEMFFVFESDTPQIILPAVINWERNILAEPIVVYIPPTPSPTPTITVTPTVTLSSSPTPTVTKSSTPTPTVTKTPTKTPVPTKTQTATPTATLTVTPTATVTRTLTKTPANTPTCTPTLTKTPTITPTVTPTVTLTSTSVMVLAEGITVQHTGKGRFVYKVFVRQDQYVVLNYNSVDIPDKYSILSSTGSLLATSGWAGNLEYNPDLEARGEPNVSGPGAGSINIKILDEPGYVYIVVDSIFAESINSIYVTLQEGLYISTESDILLLTENDEFILG